MRRYLVILLVTASLITLVLFSSLQGGNAYNVVFITLESTNAEHIGFHGYERNTTPNLDNLAEESIVFTNATSPSASTVNAVPSIFTSLYPQTDDVVAKNPRKADPAWRNNLSLISRFQDEGYYTKGIVAHEWVRSRWGFDKYFDDFDDDFKLGTMGEVPENHSLSDFEVINRYWEERNAEETTDLGIDFLKKKEGNFFLWMHYFDPHSPYMPPEKKYLDMYKTPYNGENKTEEYYIGGRNKNISGRRVHELRNRYDAELRYTDEHIGRLLETLDEEGLSEETIVVITSDHSECTGENNVFDHNKLHWCSIHVPLIVSIPGEEPKKIDEPVSTIDIMPTLLKILGIEENRFVRGKNILAGEYRDYHYAESGAGKFLLNYGDGNPIQKIESTKSRRKLKKDQNITKELNKRLKNLGYTKK